MSLSKPLSGTQFTLEHEGYSAVVTSVGASLRLLKRGDQDLIVPFGADDIRPRFRGATLAPWPNRIVDGKYSFEGNDYQLPITEVERGHALHGLLLWTEFNPVLHGNSSITLSAEIQPQDGYPWRILVETNFSIDSQGLLQTVEATNLSDTPAPWGTAPHPYLVAGISPLNEWILELPATEYLSVTETRLSPLCLNSVASESENDFDFLQPRQIGLVEIDHAFTGIRRSKDGIATVRLTEVSGNGVEMSWGTELPWVQIHTADLPSNLKSDGHRAGLAVEPMTCAPDAFNSTNYEFDSGLIVLSPGQNTRASWRISAI
jgi:aldose 1-epimerase